MRLSPSARERTLAPLLGPHRIRLLVAAFGADFQHNDMFPGLARNFGVDPGRFAIETGSGVSEHAPRPDPAEADRSLLPFSASEAADVRRQETSRPARVAEPSGCS